MGLLGTRLSTQRTLSRALSGGRRANLRSISSTRPPTPDFKPQTTDHRPQSPNPTPWTLFPVPCTPSFAP
ncbi:hypothetical protein T484DRAFT_1970467 [Baffinella frigidus]|nr:hypothetical protein T484DRAFT_1970467 [Cryptophyta sp. CCMP2293]